MPEIRVSVGSSSSRDTSATDRNATVRGQGTRTGSTSATAANAVVTAGSTSVATMASSRSRSRCTANRDGHAGSSRNRPRGSTSSRRIRSGTMSTSGISGPTPARRSRVSSRSECGVPYVCGSCTSATASTTWRSARADATRRSRRARLCPARRNPSGARRPISVHHAVIALLSGDSSNAPATAVVARSDNARHATASPTGTRSPPRSRTAGFGSSGLSRFRCGVGIHPSYDDLDAVDSLNSCPSRVRSATALRPCSLIIARPSRSTGLGARSGWTRTTTTDRPVPSGRASSMISGSNGGSRRSKQVLTILSTVSGSAPTTRSPPGRSATPTMIRPPYVFAIAATDLTSWGLNFSLYSKVKLSECSCATRAVTRSSVTSFRAQASSDVGEAIGRAFHAGGHGGRGYGRIST